MCSSDLTPTFRWLKVKGIVSEGNACVCFKHHPVQQHAHEYTTASQTGSWAGRGLSCGSPQIQLPLDDEAAISHTQQGERWMGEEGRERIG